jgi:hypothetical protein
MYANQPLPSVAVATNVCVNVPLVMSIRLPLLALVSVVSLVRATRMTSAPPTAQIGAAPEPCDVKTCPEVPNEGDEPTPSAWAVFNVSAVVVPLVCSTRLPVVSPALTSAVPVVVPAEIVLMRVP